MSYIYEKLHWEKSHQDQDMVAVMEKMNVGTYLRDKNFSEDFLWQDLWPCSLIFSYIILA